MLYPAIPILSWVPSIICLIYRSCLPNSHNSWNSDKKSETIHAIRNINVGEQITISYDNGGPSDSRRIYLEKAFGFDCNCRVCSFPLPDLQISDVHRLQIQHMDDTIGDPDRVVKRPDDCLAEIYFLLQVPEKEYDGSASTLIARLSCNAF